MTKYLVLLDVDVIRFLKVKKRARALVSRDYGLYRNDSKFYIKDFQSSDAMRFNRVSSTQPILPRAKFIDPDDTRVYIQSAKLGSGKKKRWLNMDSNNLWKYLTAIALVGSLIYGFLVYGM